MPSSSANFSAGMILPRAMPGHVGDDGLDLGNAVFFQELLNRARHTSPRSSCATFLLASPNALNSAREKAFFANFHSGCHCTPRAKPGAPGSLNASITPSVGARFDDEPFAEGSHTLPMQRIHARCAIAPGDFCQQAAGLQHHFVRRTVLHFQRLGFDRRGDPGGLALLNVLPERAAVSDVHLLKSTADGQHRHAGGDRRGISGSVVASRAGSCRVPGKLAGPP